MAIFEVDEAIIKNLSISKLLELQEQCKEILQNSTNKNSFYYEVAVDMEKLVKELLKEKNHIISIHPNRINNFLETVEKELQDINEASKVIYSATNKERYSVSGLSYPNPVWDETIMIEKKSRTLLHDIKQFRIGEIMEKYPTVNKEKLSPRIKEMLKVIENLKTVLLQTVILRNSTLKSMAEYGLIELIISELEEIIIRLIQGVEEK